MDFKLTHYHSLRQAAEGRGKTVIVEKATGSSTVIARSLPSANIQQIETVAKTNADCKEDKIA
jgi:hypothetical protein